MPKWNSLYLLNWTLDTDAEEEITSKTYPRMPQHHATIADN